MRQNEETRKKTLQNAACLGILSVKDGWIVCPGCGKHIQRITPTTEARALPVYCRGCRREIILDIDRGLSARRLSP